MTCPVFLHNFSGCRKGHITVCVVFLVVVLVFVLAQKPINLFQSWSGRSGQVERPQP